MQHGISNLKNLQDFEIRLRNHNLIGIVGKIFKFSEPARVTQCPLITLLLVPHKLRMVVRRGSCWEATSFYKDQMNFER